MTDSTTSVVDPDPKRRRREQHGWYMYDWANQVFWTSVVTVFIGPYLSDLARASAEAAGTGERVHLLGMSLHYNTVYPAAGIVAAVVQIVLLPIIGAVVDHSRNKKRLLFVFAAVGAGSTTALYLATGDSYLLATGLFLLGNLAYGCALVVYNTFLPEIATPDERDRVSATGWGFAYLGGLILLLLHLALIALAPDLGISTGHAARIAFASAGLWWIGFTILAMPRLRNRIGPLAAAARGPRVGATFRQLGRTLLELRHYPQTLLFLLAYLLFNDGIQATIRYAANFATGEEDLNLSQNVVIAAIVLIQLVAFLGSWAAGRLAGIAGTKPTLVGTLVVWTLLLSGAYFLPAGDVALFLALGVGIGLVLGGSQALARSLFSQMIPRGREGEYFGVFTICDRAGTLIASLVVLIAVELTGGYRAAVFSLVGFFVIGGILLICANLPRGIRQAGNEVPTRLQRRS